MDELLQQLAPYILWAVAVGGLVYPWRFWKSSRRRFIELYACIVIGIAVGWISTGGIDGLRGGAVIGAIAMPALLRARRNVVPVRSEVDSEHEGNQGEDSNDRIEHDDSAEAENSG